VTILEVAALVMYPDVLAAGEESDGELSSMHIRYSNVLYLLYYNRHDVSESQGFFTTIRYFIKSDSFNISTSVRTNIFLKYLNVTILINSLNQNLNQNQKQVYCQECFHKRGIFFGGRCKIGAPRHRGAVRSAILERVDERLQHNMREERREKEKATPRLCP